MMGFIGVVLCCMIFAGVVVYALWDRGGVIVLTLSTVTCMNVFLERSFKNVAM